MIRYVSLSLILLPFISLSFISLAPAMADDGEADMKTHAHETAKHSEMSAVDGKTIAEVKGKINKINPEGKVLNITHEAVEAFGWPAMTMDIPFTSKVNVETLKVDAEVQFTLKQGMDKKFRIIAVKPAE